MINTAKPIPGDESEPKATLVPDPRNERSEAAFDVIEANLERLRGHERWSADEAESVVEAVKVARRLMVPQSGPRPVTSSLDGYPDPAIRFDVESIQILTAVLVMALEGGIGYWFWREEYCPSGPPAERYATILDDEGTRHRIDLYTIQEGMLEARKLLREAQDFGWAGTVTTAWPLNLPRPGSEFYQVCERVNTLLSRNLSTDEGRERFEEAESMFDATAADTVVQLGLFGSVVYG